MSVRRWLGAVLVATVLAATAAALAGFWLHAELDRPHAAWSGDAAVVLLEPGLDAGTMLRRLEEAGVLRRPELVRAWLAWRDGAHRLHAGEYRFERPASAREVVARLQRGDVVLHPVTLPEGLTYREIAERLDQAGFGPREALIASFQDPSLIRDLDPAATDLEGYLFPDTYHFPAGERPERIARALVGRFREAVGPEFADTAAAVGFDVRDAVVLASMIERETSVEGERSRISRVFHNRLARGMKMECDPTVIYALERAGHSVGELTYADLRFDSPWNTYVVAGLPAGPIANPGLASLQAALQPSAGRELYFVAAPEGGHRFSETHAAHLQAVAAWRRYVRSSR